MEHLAIRESPDHRSILPCVCVALGMIAILGQGVLAQDHASGPRINVNAAVSATGAYTLELSEDFPDWNSLPADLSRVQFRLLDGRPVDSTFIRGNTASRYGEWLLSCPASESIDELHIVTDGEANDDAWHTDATALESIAPPNGYLALPHMIKLLDGTSVGDVEDSQGAYIAYIEVRKMHKGASKWHVYGLYSTDPLGQGAWTAMNGGRPVLSPDDARGVRGVVPRVGAACYGRSVECSSGFGYASPSGTLRNVP